MDAVYMKHITSGEVFAVKIENDEFIGICGPLRDSEMTKENIEAENFTFEYADNSTLENLVLLEQIYVGDIYEGEDIEAECSI